MNITDSAKDLGQFPTPAWAAEALMRHHYGHLSADDFVIEPTCGPGRFLQAIPKHVPALGIEIDPVLAQRARELTGRTVITGDFLEVAIDRQASLIVGNPPFVTKFIDCLLERSFELLREEGQVAMILPAYALQTAGRVVRYNAQWGIEQTFLPRNLYTGLQYPLCWVRFSKSRERHLVGFLLYDELAYLQDQPKDVQEAMTVGPVSWRSVVSDALDMFGGAASLSDIYDYVADRRPTANPNWKAQVRKVCQQSTKRVAPARYAKPEQLEMLAA